MPTTLVISNLPSSLTQVELIGLLDCNGFGGTYDFVFLPTANFATWETEGCAIVNCVNNECAAALQTALHGWSCHLDGNACEVLWSSAVQGLQDLVKTYQTHEIMNWAVPDEVKPMVFFAGVRVPL